MTQATPEQAHNIARYLLGSHPNQAHDPDVLLEQLVTLFTGKPYDLLLRMINPETGVLRDSKFVPSVPQCADWLDARMPRPEPYQRPALPRPEHKPRTPEEIERNIRLWEETKKKLLANSEFLRRKKRPRWDEGQTLKPTEAQELERYIADPETP